MHIRVVDEFEYFVLAMTYTYAKLRVVEGAGKKLDKIKTRGGNRQIKKIHFCLFFMFACWLYLRIIYLGPFIV